MFVPYYFSVNKILNLKLYDNEGKRWAKSVVDKQYEILCVSQFTLYYTLKSNKPSFHHAMPSPQSEQFYQKVLETLRTRYRPELIKGDKKKIVYWYNNNIQYNR